MKNAQYVPLVGLVLAACASMPTATAPLPVHVVVVAGSSQVGSDAARLGNITAEAIRRKDHSGHAARVFIMLASRDLTLRNRSVLASLDYGAPLFGANADLSKASHASGERHSPNMAATVILGSYTITDAAGNVLISEPFNLGFREDLLRKLVVFRATGEYIADRVAQLQ